MLVLLAALTGLATGCKYSKETVPVTRNYDAVRVPNQQRLVALATDEAVEALDFAPLAGKSVAIEVSGIFPHSSEDLLAYLSAQVEAKLARSGVRVVNTAPVLVVPGLPGAPAPAGSAAAPAGGGGQALQLGEPADYRVLIGVSWGGIDTRDKVRTDEPLLTKQISLGAGGLLLGTFLAAISDSSFRKGFATVIALGAPVGAYLWYRNDSPFPHTYTLIGRVRVVAQALPLGAGTAFTTEGKGQSRLIVDEANPEGYMVAQ